MSNSKGQVLNFVIFKIRQKQKVKFKNVRFKICRKNQKVKWKTSDSKSLKFKTFLDSKFVKIERSKLKKSKLKLLSNSKICKNKKNKNLELKNLNNQKKRYPLIFLPLAGSVC